MENPGIEYAVIMHDPQLRKGLVHMVRASHQSKARSSPSWWCGLYPARARLIAAAGLTAARLRVQPASVLVGLGIVVAIVVGLGGRA